MLFYYQEFVTKSYSSEDLGRKSMNKVDFISRSSWKTEKTTGKQIKEIMNLNMVLFFIALNKRGGFSSLKLSQDKVTFLPLKIKSNGISSIKTRTEQQKFTNHENYALCNMHLNCFIICFLIEDDFQKNSVLLKRRRTLILSSQFSINLNCTKTLSYQLWGRTDKISLLKSTWA